MRQMIKKKSKKKSEYVTLKQLDMFLDSHMNSHAQITIDIMEVLDAVKRIDNTLNSVQANGRAGLSNSISDIYNKLNELFKVTEALRTRKKIWTSLKHWKETSALSKAIHSKIGKLTCVGIVSFIIISVIHAVGIIDHHPIELIPMVFDYISKYRMIQ